MVVYWDRDRAFAELALRARAWLARFRNDRLAAPAGRVARFEHHAAFRCGPRTMDHAGRAASVRPGGECLVERHVVDRSGQDEDFLEIVVFDCACGRGIDPG